MTNGPKGPDFFGMTEKELLALLKEEQKKAQEEVNRQLKEAILNDEENKIDVY